MSTAPTPEGESRGIELSDRLALNETAQVVRALAANGPQTEEELAVLVGAPYWERNRFHRTVVNGLAEGVLERDCYGLIRVR